MSPDRRPGERWLHTTIDDHSRVAYVEAHDDEAKETATAVLKNAVAWFAERGVTVKRVISDNGGCYKSDLSQQTCSDLGITPKKTRPYRSQTNGKIEPVPPHAGRGVGVQEVLQLRVSPHHSSASMDPRVQPPPAPLSVANAAHCGSSRRRH